MKNYSGLIALLLSFFCIFFSIRWAAVPAPLKRDVISDTIFSAKRAYVDLLEIAKQPHSIGTPENAEVRNYIVAACKKAGLTVDIQHSLAVTNFRKRVTAANVYNIIAHKKGLRNSKSILLMAHYDSKFHTSGAGDDGAGVAAMLETARIIQQLPPLKNDIIFLFTDGEEVGLTGAYSFIKENVLMKQVGLVLNFEGRGNAGISTMFEVNSENGWIMKEYARAVAHPFANSLSYEVYKNLPNSTDYTLFKYVGIAGLNNAYINGFVNYHSPTDTPENMDLRSLQNQGENMLSLVKHFGNLTITTTKATDVSYFNILGSWFVFYPVSWNLVLVILTNLLFLFYIGSCLVNKKISIANFIFSVFFFLLVLVVIFFINYYLGRAIVYFYPLYAHFYENNSYNSHWYFFAITALVITILSAVYFWMAKRISLTTLQAGIFCVVALLMNLMQYAVPAASYLCFIPLMAILIIQIIRFFFKVGDQLWKYDALNLLGAVPAILILAPVIYLTFIAFGLGRNMPIIAVLVGIFAGLLLPGFFYTFKNKRVIPIAAGICFILALADAHVHSAFDEGQPLQVGIRYQLNADSATAKWISVFPPIDSFTKEFIKNPVVQNSNNHEEELIFYTKAPVLPLAAATATVLNDTVKNGQRNLLVHFNTNREKASILHIAIKDSSKVSTIILNRDTLKASDNEGMLWHKQISYYGLTSAGFTILFVMPHNTKLDFVVSDRSLGLPAISGFPAGYITGFIPAREGNCNVTQVNKHFVL